MESTLERKRGSPGGGSKFPSFLGMQDEELHSLSAHAKLQSFPRNKIIINEGDRTDSVYVIHSGRVKVFLYGRNGKEIDLNILGPGEYFGEMVLDSGPRSASVMTLEPAQFFIIPQSVFRDFVIKHPEFAMRLIKTLIFRARGLLNNVRSLASLDVYGRVARLLLELAGEEDGKLVINGKLTKQEIANRVGASREMISRVFKDLTQGGYIEVEKARITIAKVLPDHW
jgi:CRP/FNR family cyclic AMP-dependent transcriptional regulator